MPVPRMGKKLSGKIFVLTGSLESIARQEAHQKIRMLGGRPTNSVSKEIDYLVVGSEPGSKKSQTARFLLASIEKP